MARKPKAKYDPQDYKIPVFIGVTGHRNPRSEGDDTDRLTESIKEALKRIIKKSQRKEKKTEREETKRSRRRAMKEAIRGNCRYTEFIVLTAAGVGADQFVANVAKERGIKYGVVLPFEQEHYLNRINEEGERDFSEQEADDTRKFIEQAAFVHTLPWFEGYTPPDDHRIPSEVADRQFKEVARFISDSSYAGIALWDGKLERTAVAGTGPTVRDSLQGKQYKSKHKERVSMPETRPIFHIFTPREGDEAKDTDYKLREIYPLPILESGDTWFTAERYNAEKSEEEKKKEEKDKELRAQSVRRMLASIDRYNKDVTKNRTLRRQLVRAKTKALLEGKAVSEEKRNIQRLTDVYCASDALSNISHDPRNRLIWAIIIVAGLAYTALNVFSDLNNDLWFLLPAGYIGGLLLAALIVLFARWFKYHDRYVEYRALAEGLRVQNAWYRGRVTESDGELAQVQNHYLTRQRGRIDWIRQALRNLNLLAISDGIKPGIDREELEAAAADWLGRADERKKRSDGTVYWEMPTAKLKHNGQAGYFENKYNMTKKRSKLALGIALVCTAVSLLLACVYSVLIVVDHSYRSDLMMFVVGVLPVAAMVCHEINTQMGFKEDSERTEWHYLLFRRAIGEIDEARKDFDENKEREDAQFVEEEYLRIVNNKLLSIGSEELIENADWVMLNSERSPQVPIN